MKYYIIRQLTTGGSFVYWNGKSIDLNDIGSWSVGIKNAIRLFDETSAKNISRFLLKGCGQVIELEETQTIQE